VVYQVVYGIDVNRAASATATRMDAISVVPMKPIAGSTCGNGGWL
jgi:hypothetical protein